ncbi:MAG TPA: hypothetical protein PKZ41_05050 [Candidatus Omnitrophota bacterium]|nr:hypothetical protein [Candidatus Omnitrophota bacterium]
MSNVTVGKILSVKEAENKRRLQACEIGGSLYGKVHNHAVQTGKSEPEAKNDLASSYKNFYRNQMDTMSKVFGRDPRKGN